MEKLENENKNIINIINNISDKSPSTQIKRKKKKIKKQKEKKCSGLKELLEQINKEKLEKKKKAKEKEKTNNIKDDSKIKSSEVIIQNENEEKNKDLRKDYINIANNSISGTTVATLSPEDYAENQKFNFDKNLENLNKNEYCDLTSNYLIKNIDIEDEKVEEENNKRKMSSPICDYYDGCDKILSETYKGSIDMSNSMNFIKKEDFITSNCNMNNNYFNNNYNELNNYINPDNYNKNKEQIEEINNSIYNNHELLYKNNINLYNELYEYNNIPYSQFMDYYYSTIPENISISKFSLLNDLNIKNKSKLSKKNNKIYKKSKNISKSSLKIPLRKGDWLCTYCFNLNFSFRTYCNKCKVPKK